VLLSLFLAVLLFGRPRPVEEPQALLPLAQMVHLPALTFPNPAMLFDPADYRRLCAQSGLAPVAGRLLQDRRRLVLLWLGLLRRDVHTLWRFRRLLTRYGVSSGPGEEAGVATSALLTLAMLNTLRATVWAAGPFALAPLLDGAATRVETASRRCAALLHRLPPSRLPEVQRAWLAA
jgi:hypothetical protein